MQKHKNIKALFFLGIFGMLLLHQILPHSHHQHNQYYAEHHHDVSYNDHDHHHENPQEHNSKKGIFDWFLEAHSHTYTTTNVLVLEQTTVKKILTKKELIKTVGVNTNKLVFTDDVGTSSKKWCYQPDKLQNTYFLGLSLRGPPYLG